ncbi:hypothetical protein llap_12259 [Limosa lapponica baueri]|uniref:Uncharacterized protein n=1 Tax=Limosa lapponica baueri TaxID=1758121 RepID=A0A2I0TUG0_LIMLA|nr:hypothetical protein llap_12259 [Limosa lapponica baueri]
MTTEDHVALVKNAGSTTLDDIANSANSEHCQRGRQSNFVEWQTPGHTNTRSSASWNHSLNWTPVIWKAEDGRDGYTPSLWSDHNTSMKIANMLVTNAFRLEIRRRLTLRGMGLWTPHQTQGMKSPELLVSHW